MAAPGKDGKDKKSSKEEVPSLRRIAGELIALRADIDAMKAHSVADRGNSADTQQIQSKDDSRTSNAGHNQSRRLQQMLSGANNDAAVAIQYAYQITDSEGTACAAADDFLQHGLEAILSVEDSRVARLGYALSSAPKVAILRALLANGSQSAAQIGEKAKLTTGSLYHHLRELTHDAVIESSARNRFELTEIGRQTVLLLFVQAGRIP